MTDQPERGRSAYLPGDGSLSAFPRQSTSKLFTAPDKVRPLPYPQASLHTQWPGTGTPGDPIFDAFYASQVAYQANVTLQAIYSNASYVALLDRIGSPVIAIVHSQAGPYGWQLADARPDLLAGLVAIEPGTGPFTTWRGPPYVPGYIPAFPDSPYGVTLLPLTYSPALPKNDPAFLTQQIIPPTQPDRAPCTLQAEPARKLTNVAKVPVLTFVGEGSYHQPFARCIAAYMAQAGVNITSLSLDDVGIHGNGHFSFMEKNNIEIAQKVVDPFLQELEA